MKLTYLLVIFLLGFPVDVFSHTVGLCIGIDPCTGQTGVFAGSYHAPGVSGGMLVRVAGSSGAFTRYNFQTAIPVSPNALPPGVPPSACSFPCAGQGYSPILMWQYVLFPALPAGNYELTTTCDTASECPWGPCLTSIIPIGIPPPNQPPTANCPANINVNTAANSCSAPTSFTITGSDDCYGGVTVSSVPPSGSAFPKGSTAVTGTVTDPAGLTASCSFSVTVTDAQPPSAVCSSQTILLSPTSATASPAAATGSSTDNCGITTRTLSQSAFNCANLGSNTVTATVGDSSGNSASCSATVIVQDNTNPTASCSPQTIVLSPNSATASAVTATSGSSDNCAITTRALSQTTFTCANLGSNTVSATVADGSGNSASCSATVTVQDNTNPVASCSSQTIVLSPTSATASSATATASSTDNCGITTRSLSQTTFTCANLGPNTVTATVRDSSGNTATCAATVNVQDNTNPVASCSSQTIVLSPTTATASAGTATASSTDNCGITTRTLSQTTFSCANLGSNTVTATVGDSTGNSASCSATVIVQDNTNPSITCPSSFSFSIPPGQCTASVSYPPASISDNCPGVSVTYSLPNPVSLPVGPTTVVAVARDSSGNSASCSFVITVIDTTPPVIQCPSSVDAQTDTGRCDAAVSFFVTSNDFCGGSSVVSTPASGSIFQLGTTVVTSVATDTYGNTATCTFPVTVYDKEAAVLNCPGDIRINAINGVCSNTATYTPTFTENCASRIGTYGMFYIPYDANDYSGGTSVYNGGSDDLQTTVGLPFTFSFYGTSVNSVIVATNGFIQFPNSGCISNGLFQYQPVTGTGCPRGYVAGLWADLYVYNTGDVSVKTVGTAPSRVFVISYTVGYFSRGSNTYNRFQFRLFETTNIIEVHYETYFFESGRLIAAGIQQPSGGAGTQFQYTTSQFSTPIAVRYIPIVTTVPSLVPASGTLFPVGSTSVTYAAVDSFGSVSSCDFTVTVVDNQLPTITCPTVSPITVSAPVCSATVVYPNIATSDNCGTSSVIFNPASGFNFPVGTTSVSATVIDNSGQSASCTFPVTIVDPSNRCLCGNGKVDSGEQCEINQLGSATCVSQGFTLGGVLDCTNCRYDTSRCAVCGDNRIDGTEVCDDSNLNSQTCLTVPGGFTSGVLACNAGCNGFVTSGCTKCGDNTIQGTEECDGTNLNGKTCLTLLGTASGGGTLSCTGTCKFNTSSCVVPVVTLPSSGLVIDHQTLGIRVKATGFANDRKVTVSLTDGLGHTKAYTGISLALPAGSLDATMQAPSPLAPSTSWKVSVKGESTLFVAYSGVFTVRSL